MDKENYISMFEEFADDAGISISENLLNKLALRSIELEKEYDFTIDDIFEEITDIIPSRFQNNDEWIEFLNEVTNFVFDEKENGEYDIADEE